MKEAKNALDAAIHGTSGKSSGWYPFKGTRDTLTRAAVAGGAIYGGKEGSQADAMDRDVRKSLGLREKDWFGRNKGAIAGTLAGFGGGLAGRVIAKKSGLALGGLGTLVGVGLGSKIASGMTNKYVADQNRKERDREIELMKLKNQSNFTDMYQTRQFNKLTDFVKNHQSALIGAGVGAGAGAAGGYLMDKKANRKGNWLKRNAGALIGGAAGAGLGFAAGNYGFKKNAPLVSRNDATFGATNQTYTKGANTVNRYTAPTIAGQGGKALPNGSGVTLTNNVSGKSNGSLYKPAYMNSGNSGESMSSIQEKFLGGLRENEGLVAKKTDKLGPNGQTFVHDLYKNGKLVGRSLSDYLDHVATKYYAGSENIAASTMNISKTEGKQAQGFFGNVGNFAKTNWKGAAIGATALGAAGAGIGGIVAKRRNKNKKKAMALGAGIGALAGGIAGAGLQHFTRRQSALPVAAMIGAPLVLGGAGAYIGAQRSKKHAQEAGLNEQDTKSLMWRGGLKGAGFGALSPAALVASRFVGNKAKRKWENYKDQEGTRVQSELGPLGTAALITAPLAIGGAGAYIGAQRSKRHAQEAGLNKRDTNSLMWRGGLKGAGIATLSPGALIASRFVGNRAKRKWEDYRDTVDQE